MRENERETYKYKEMDVNERMDLISNLRQGSGNLMAMCLEGVGQRRKPISYPLKVLKDESGP